MTATGDAQTRRVLVVDDECEVLRILARFLTRKHYWVDVARSGEEALAFLECDRADVVLLDIHMPELDGLATLREIRKRKAAPPVIIVSGTTDLNLAKNTLAEGAVEYVVKPLELDYLEWCLRHVLASRSP